MFSIISFLKIYIFIYKSKPDVINDYPNSTKFKKIKKIELQNLVSVLYLNIFILEYIILEIY